jgi:muramoyltetrapeptide carboxypeptidase
MCTQLGEDPAALQRLQALLTGKDPGPIEWQPQTARGGRVEAVLRGGNLASLASMCGTPLQPQFGGALVLLEDLNEPPYRLDRMLTQLLLCGAFERAKGFIIGDLVAEGEDPAGRAEAVSERLLPLGVPVVFGAPFGHAGRNQPVAFGVRHALDADAGRLEAIEQPTARPAA